jgi:hypothetical protein
LMPFSILLKGFLLIRPPIILKTSPNAIDSYHGIHRRHGKETERVGFRTTIRHFLVFYAHFPQQPLTKQKLSRGYFSTK